jgi:hypothetical protein
VGDRDFPSTWDAEARSHGLLPRGRALRVAPGKGGALVARLDLTRYDEITVLCGDGCRGFPQVEGEEAMRARGQAALSPGILLRAAAPRDSGWHLSLEFEDLPQLEHLLVRLSQSGPVTEIRMAPLDRARTPNGRLVDVVYVRYERER